MTIHHRTIRQLAPPPPPPPSCPSPSFTRLRHCPSLPPSPHPSLLYFPVGLVERHPPGVCWLVSCLTSQQHASVSQGQICTDNLTCCHTEIKVADQTFYLTQSQCPDTGPTSPSADPIMPGAWQGNHWSANL